MVTDSVVYFLLAADAKMVKIGVTTDLASRQTAIQACSPVRLTLACTIPGDESMEQAMHRRFASSRAHFEWFRLTPEIANFIQEVKAGIWAPAPRPGFVEIFTPGGRVRATPEQFFRTFRLFFGRNWPSGAAKVLGVSSKTIQRWHADAAHGICSIPQTALRGYMRFMDEKMRYMRATLTRLREPDGVVTER